MVIAANVLYLPHRFLWLHTLLGISATRSRSSTPPSGAAGQLPWCRCWSYPRRPRAAVRRRCSPWRRLNLALFRSHLTQSSNPRSRCPAGLLEPGKTHVTFGAIRLVPLLGCRAGEARAPPTDVLGVACRPTAPSHTYLGPDGWALRRLAYGVFHATSDTRPRRENPGSGGGVLPCGRTITIRRANDRGPRRPWWLDTFTPFLFDVTGPPATWLGTLRVINGTAFAGTGSHARARDMEIITYVSRRVEHASLGNRLRDRPGTCSAGAGTAAPQRLHRVDPTRPLLQIWTSRRARVLRRATSRRISRTPSARGASG